MYFIQVTGSQTKAKHWVNVDHIVAIMDPNGSNQNQGRAMLILNRKHHDDTVFVDETPNQILNQMPPNYGYHTS